MGFGSDGKVTSRRAPLVGVNPNVIHQHFGWKWCSAIGQARPIAADGQIQDDETALARVKRPDCTAEALEIRRRESGIRVGGIINIVGYRSRRPNYAVGMPSGCRLSGREVVRRAQTGVAGEARAVNRAFVPVGRKGGVDPFEHILLAARRPANGGDVVAEEPGGRPQTLRLGNPGAEFEPSVLKAEETLRLETRGCIDTGGGLLGFDVKEAIGSDESAGTGCAAGRCR